MRTVILDLTVKNNNHAESNGVIDLIRNESSYCVKQEKYNVWHFWLENYADLKETETMFVYMSNTSILQ